MQAGRMRDSWRRVEFEAPVWILKSRPGSGLNNPRGRGLASSLRKSSPQAKWEQFSTGYNVTAINQLFSLDGHVALITGASRGLGLAMAEGLAEAGATIVANGRSTDRVEAAAVRLRERGLKAHCSSFDVTDHGAARAAIDTIVSRYGRIDTLIANAGINHRVALAEWTPEDWDRVVSTNLNACFFLAQHVAVTMRRQGRGRIIFTTSIAGVPGLGKVHGYTASKSGLIGTHAITCVRTW